MIFFKKTDGSAEIQALLDKARASDNMNVYRSGLVYEQLKADFHGKCYLCEDDEPTSIQVEHFEPHKDDPLKKYDWCNLFFSCGHCNNLKGARFWPLLNCTAEADRIWESIEIRFNAFPKPSVEIIAHPAVDKVTECNNTRLLLESTLVGKNTTPIKTDEAANLRKKMLRAYNSLAVAIKNKDLEAVRNAVSNKAAFAGMLRWTLKNEFPEIFANLLI
jgi:hypothetical protein